MYEQVHELRPADVYPLLHSRAEGLRAEEVAELQAELGPNRIEVRQRYWWLRSLVKQLTNFFSILLDISAAICFLADYVQPGEGMALLGWALLGVSLLNASFSFFQEFRAERAMEALRRFLPHAVSVRREGAERSIAAEELVPGDVIILREGDKIPADARLVECDGLLANNAPLTGESRPVALTEEPTESGVEEAQNLARAGCSVLRGSGVGIVFATGFRTLFGRIAALSHEIRREPSPLERETAHMVRVLTIIAVVMGLVFFAYGVYTGRSLWVNLVFMMGIIVANVPEGLLPTFTLSLAVGSLRMARRNVLVKSLNAVEALGAVHVVCTDKTGTLTQNRLVLTIVHNEAGHEISDSGDERALLELALGACEVNRAKHGFAGDPVDVAVAERYAALDGDPDEIAGRIVQRFPFDAQLRRSAGIAGTENGFVFAVKGAWEAIAPMLDPASQGLPADQLDATVTVMASRGARVLAVAAKPLQATPGDEIEQLVLEHGLALAGFICFSDPLRPEVPNAVQRCHEAGIRVVMITGDHPDTAQAVARAAGIAVEDDLEPLTGDQVATMREQDLKERLRLGVNVVARTTPEQKMKIVAALHELDLVVAVTGDGVNDAPALKAADVGIAMGVSGTDVARESAQVVLLDDNFASIVTGVEEGRAIFANIKKFTNYVLVSNGPEIIPYLIYIVFPVPLALTVIQILAIDLGTDIIPSMALGQEPPDTGVMKEAPRERDEGLLTPALMLHSYGFLGLLEAAFALSLFFWVLVDGGWKWGDDLAPGDPLYLSATGITLSSILLMQIGNLVGRRSRVQSGIDVGLLRNPLLVVGVAMEMFFSWAVLYLEPIGRVLGTGPVEVHVYLVAWLGIPLIFGLDYLRKLMVRSRMDLPAPV
jgi:sodium/potassium-transporting ATPase subunit alpha